MDNTKFVYLDEEIPNIILDMRYYSTYNFVGERIDGYVDSCAILSKEAAKALKEVSKDLFEKGYVLKIYDAYRPQMAVEHFIRWSKDFTNNKMRTYFYPNLTKEEIFKKGFIEEKSAHSRGSSVDLTLYDYINNKDIDMGGSFDLFDDISYTDTEKITLEQKDNRKILKDTMLKYGFENYEKEWWHYTLKDEPYKDTYFNFYNRKGL